MRAIRRHHYERLKQKYAKREQRWRHPDMYDASTDPYWLGVHANTHTRCSCWMCSRSRRYHGPSIQEIRADKPQEMEAL